MIDDLFKFPIILIDGMNEEQKAKSRQSMGLNTTDDIDIIYAEAEYPYYDFIGIEDRWLPNQQSLDRAMRGKFNCCMVMFQNSGTHMVPWTKEKFKNAIQEFSNIREESKRREDDTAMSDMKILKINKDELREMFKDGE